VDQLNSSGTRKVSMLKEELELGKVIRELFSSQRLAVLGTQSDGQPYANLVAFVASDDLESIFFATARSTRKYANIEADSRVTVLIDNRSNQEADFSKAVAVTATGRAQEVGESQRKLITETYLAKHPILEEFVRSPSCAIIKVRVETYYLVSRFQNVMELHVK
jgi:nitroimidazol reductase NimA-like FMN-containing flavoprotein (pyridoxamine 5'-phosphate oxidase superfamily)